MSTGGFAVRLRRFLPFLAWFPISAVVVRADLIAGITGALVLVPKAMAYAQLSGLPVHFGLYVAFVPAILGALWGSSRQLATGPVAVVSLMTAAALTPLAAPFSGRYIELALVLTLIVGTIQFSLGVLKLGTIVNFVSHPVILGFMNAAAIIIALSQLDMLLRIPKGRSGFFLGDIWETLGYLPQTHWPTLAMSAFALVLMLVLNRLPRISRVSVLLAVAITVVVSATIGFERRATVPIAAVGDVSLREQLSAYERNVERVRAVQTSIATQAEQLRALPAGDSRARAELRHSMHLNELEAGEIAETNRRAWRTLSRLELDGEPAEGGAPNSLLPRPAGAGSRPEVASSWRIVGVSGGRVQLTGGGDVVGTVPQGLPALRVPKVGWSEVSSLLQAAFVIALVAFMESIAMAKALSAVTRQRLDPNQELIGQGVANLGGAFFQSYPACGSFTGSAINMQAGAQTGLAMVFNGLFVVVTLLVLTPFLYHLPKATLGVIILLAVTSLVTPRALLHTWRASRADGMVAAVTFCVTLLSAPHLDRGILVGAGLAVLLYLLKTMKPRVAELGRHADGVLRDVRANANLATSDDIVVLRFDDALYFANAAFFEEQVLDAVVARPAVKHLLIVGGGINQIDASGDEVLRHLVQQLRAGGVEMSFSGLKRQVREVMRATKLDALIGAEHLFATEEQALEKIYGWLGRDGRDELQPNRTSPAVPH